MDLSGTIMMHGLLEVMVAFGEAITPSSLKFLMTCPAKVLLLCSVQGRLI